MTSSPLDKLAPKPDGWAEKQLREYWASYEADARRDEADGYPPLPPDWIGMVGIIVDVKPIPINEVIALLAGVTGYGAGNVRAAVIFALDLIKRGGRVRQVEVDGEIALVKVY